MTVFRPYNHTPPEYFNTDHPGIAIRVNGEPAPQGSKRAFVVNGHAVLTESSTKVKPWRSAVVDAAVDAMNGRAPLAGPVVVTVAFRLPKPRTVKRVFPSVRPDLDKLTRSTLDALTTARVYTDDGQACDLHVTKRYGIPGADITVTVLDPMTKVAA